MTVPQSQEKRAVLTSEEKSILRDLGASESEIRNYRGTEAVATPPISQQDSETLKALEIANIRLKAANEQIALLNDRLAAKDEVIRAKEGTIAVRDEQLALAQSAHKDRVTVNTGDAVMLRACEQQLTRADIELARLRNPGFLRSVFDGKSITGAVVGFGLGRITQ